MKTCSNCGVDIEYKKADAAFCSGKCYNVIYLRENKEKVAKSRVKYRQDNKEKIVKYMTKYRRENKEEIARSNAKYIRENPGKAKAHRDTRRARRLSLPGSFTAEQWEQKLEEHNCRCSYCYTHQDDLDATLELEHIVPLSKGGSHAWNNIVPACKSCNSSKGNKSLLWYLAYRRDVTLDLRIAN